MLALLAVLLCGVPHGAADASLAARAKLADGTGPLLLLMLAYALTALVFVGFWLLLPLVGLAVFFALTAWHFGRGDALAHGPDNLPLRGAAHGGLIFLIPTAHWPETLRLFDLLTGGVPAALHAVFLAVSAAWLLLLVGLLAARIMSRKALLEIVALGLMVWLLPPLPAFAVYFVGVHSARHFRRLAVQAGMQRPQDWGLSAGLAALSIVVIAAAAAVMLDGLAVSDALAKTVFIALAGLTVPHMLLVDGLQLLTKTEEARRHAA